MGVCKVLTCDCILRSQTNMFLYKLAAQFWPMVADHKAKINISFVDALRLDKQAQSASQNSNKASKSAEKTEDPIVVTEPMEES